MKTLFQVSLLFALFSVSLAEAVRINEFLASNKLGVKDAYGDRSDWIEVYNDSDEDVNLEGYGLSDSARKPYKWTFPSTNLAARSYLVVFASDRSVSVPGKELHCGFKLSAEGEYLGFCDKEGKMLSEFSPTFPPQYPDISYGWSGEAKTEKISLLSVTNDCRICVPGNGALDEVWFLEDFNDDTWYHDKGSVGYEHTPGKAPDISGYINVNLHDSMFNFNRAAFIRYPFVLKKKPGLYSLKLRMRYKDSFEAYLNGKNVYRDDDLRSFGYASYASQARDDSKTLVWKDFDISSNQALLHGGTNVLCILGATASLRNDEFLVNPLLEGEAAVSFVDEQQLYMLTPTPGDPNLKGVDELLGKVTAVPEPGFFEEPFELRFRCETEGAKIIYTLDGTAPSKNNGTIYRGHFTVDKTTIVRAIAFKEGAGGAEEFTGTFVFLDELINSPDGVPPGSLWPDGDVNGQRLDYGMDTRITQAAEYKDAMLPGMKQLPFLSLVVSPGNLFNASTGIYVNPRQDGKNWERQAHLELLNHDGAPGFSIGCGLRIRGGSSRAPNNPKHSLRLFFRDEWGKGKLDFPLFEDEGVDSFKKMDLRTTQTFSWHFEGDAYQSTYCRDEFVRDLSLKMGMPATRSRYYHLLLNGHYWGIYTTEERPDENFAASYLGGDKDDYDVIKPDNLMVAATSGNMEAYTRLWQAATNGFSDASYKKILDEGLLDPTNVADVAILNSIVCNADSSVAVDDLHVNNFFALYNRREPKGFTFIGHDNEYTLSKEIYSKDLTEDTSVGKDLVYFNSRYLHQKLMAAPEYRKIFISRVCKHYFNGGALEVEKMQKLFMEKADAIYDAVVCESARWGDIRAPYADRLPLRRDRDWQPTVDYIRDKFLPHRYDLTLEQYRKRGWFPAIDPPKLSIPGGAVPKGTAVIISGERQILYTTDGSDPFTSKTAEKYDPDSPPGITADMTFRCCYSKKEVGYPMRAEASFTVTDESPLCISEVMYAPASPTEAEQERAGRSLRSREMQYLEIYNPSVEAQKLSGLTLSGDVSFVAAESEETLAPLSYGVLVSSLSGFRARYTDENIRIIGQYSDYLPSQTISLFLNGAHYSLEGRWYSDCYAKGYSLTLADIGSPYAYSAGKTAWQSSSEVGGSPGRAETPEPCSLLLLLLPLFLRRTLNV